MSWPMVKLGDVADRVDYGLTASAIDKHDGPRFLRITDLQNDSVEWDDVPSCDCTDKEFEANKLAVGDIVFARTGATTGKSFLIRNLPKPSVFASYLIRVRPDTSVDSGYLSHFFKSPIYWNQITNMANGAAQPGVNSSKLKELEIPLPPLAEQKRIAAILDKADSIRRKRQQAIQLADDFLRAVFLEMFGNPVTNPKGWEVKTIDELAADEKYAIKAGPFGSALKKEDYVEQGYKIYGQEQVIRDDLNFGDYYIDKNKFESLKTCAVSAGDLLISLVGSFGKIAVVPEQFDKGIINPRLMKVKFNDKIASPWFMKYLLTTTEMLRKIESLSHGGTMGILNVGKVKQLDVITPPLESQEHFLSIQSKVLAVRNRFSKEDNFELFNSLSQKAFSGLL